MLHLPFEGWNVQRLERSKVHSTVIMVTHTFKFNLYICTYLVIALHVKRMDSFLFTKPPSATPFWAHMTEKKDMKKIARTQNTGCHVSHMTTGREECSCIRQKRKKEKQGINLIRFPGSDIVTP